MQSTACCSSTFHIPFLNRDVEISVRDQKTMAVALASILLCGVQLALSWPITFAVSSFLTSLTYFCEDSQADSWFSTDFDRAQLGGFLALVLLRPFIMQLIFWGLGVPLPPFPQEGIAEAILEAPWRMIPVVALIAPFAEEILFRGVFLERLQDAFSWMSRHVIHLSEDCQRHLSNVIQGVVFGALHLKGIIQEGTRLLVFSVISCIGTYLAYSKQKRKSLLPPIATHSAINISSIAYIFLAAFGKSSPRRAIGLT